MEEPLVGERDLRSPAGRPRHRLDRALRRAGQDRRWREACPWKTARLRELATGTYLPRAEPILFLGESGTGKTHLATALGMAATPAGHGVRFVTASQLVIDLVEARGEFEQLSGAPLLKSLLKGFHYR